MSESILSRLAEFSPTDTTPRLVSAIFSVIPGAPALPPYPALPSVVAALGGGPEAMGGASRHLNDPDLADVLWMSGLVDSGDRGYAVVTGVSSALKMFFGSGIKSEALETDDQQRNDAVLKAFALAYIAWKAFPGTLPERAAAFAAAPAGRALLTWYAAIEIGLPFADNALSSGGNAFSTLMDRYGSAQLQRFSGLLGSKGGEGVPGALAALTGPIQSAVTAVEPHMARVADTAKQHLPGAMNTGDKVAGVLANVADVLPVYRFLGARLAAEAAVLRGR